MLCLQFQHFAVHFQPVNIGSDSLSVIWWVVYCQRIYYNIERTFYLKKNEEQAAAVHIANI